MSITHICGTVCIQAKNTFLNGLGNMSEGKEDVSTPKFFIRENGTKQPYVSAQCWRRWWRQSFETMVLPALEASPVEKKLMGIPLINPSDDLFGYFEANPLKIDINEVNKRNVSQVRSSPIQITQLHPVQEFGHGKDVGLIKDKAYVHLQEGTPLPYSSVFYNADLQFMLGIDVARVGFYRNFNDRQEIADSIAETYIKKGYLIKSTNGGYQINDAAIIRKARVLAALEGLLVIHGGAKSAQYGTDITPRLMLLAGQDGGNPVLSGVLRAGARTIKIDVDLLLATVKRHASLFKTPVYCGMRAGYVENEAEIIARAPSFAVDAGVELVPCSPGMVVKRLAEVAC
ncbi:MAG: type I-B CRISPR-associated protein Cas7/Cst2/DevR [Candidatus Lokiarchaeota archaeon]|nr:type I-B CRISPR-associated protein Cas7/Cst2/DevR [Candidatus Lokiarchaeota archaeon]